ncbi:MAG: hypothetical protein Q8P91_02330 [bacterium]|nr:hypothetical protein [bacterium]
MKGFIKNLPAGRQGRTGSQPDFFKQKKFTGKMTSQKFNVSQFKTQHKGG